MSAGVSIEELRTRVGLGQHEVTQTSSSEYPGDCWQFDDSWNQAKFEENFRVNVIQLTPTEMEFDMVGIHAGVANAFRRILLAEVPTMAIEKVFVYNNTSIIQDEVLAHRLGLIPIHADPRLFQYRSTLDDDSWDENTRADNTLEFELKIRCSKNPHPPRKDSTAPEEIYVSHRVLSEHMEWKPIGNQAEWLKDIRPVDNDILIAKLRPGQEIHVKLHAAKGIGRDHAKFSPVATATYRLMPEITLLKSIRGNLAEKLVGCFSDGVIALEVNDDGEKEARVVNARKDTCSREVFRHDDLKDLVRLSKIRDHFIFLVESTGALRPEELVVEAIEILMSKCQAFISELKVKD